MEAVCFFWDSPSPWYHDHMKESNYYFLIDYYRCQKALDAKGVDTAPCDWYKRVYKSLCPLSWVNIPSLPTSVQSISSRIVHKDHLLSIFGVSLRLRNGTLRGTTARSQGRSEDRTVSKTLHQGNRNASVCGIVSPQPSRALSKFV